MPPGTASSHGDRRSASPGRLSTSTIPIAPAAARARRLETNVQTPRETSAIAPLSERAGSGLGPPFGFPGRAAQVARSTGDPFVPDDRADVDERLVRERPGGGRCGSGGAREGNAREHVRRARPRDGERRGEDVRVGDGGDRDRVGRRPWRPGRAEAEVVAVVAGGDDRDDAGGRDVRDRLDERVVGRVGLRARRPRS